MVSLTDFEAFLPLVLPEVPTCPDTTALAALRRAARDFCIYTHAWTETIDPIPLAATVADYELFSPVPDTRVLMAVSMNHRGLPVTAVTEEQLHASAWRWRQRTGAQMVHFLCETQAVARLFPIPTVSETPGLTDLRASLAPTIVATQIGTRLYDEHAEGIAFGALEYLLRLPKRGWTNPQLANFHHSEYVQAKSRARRQARMGFAPTERAASYRLPGAP